MVGWGRSLGTQVMGWGHMGWVGDRGGRLGTYVVGWGHSLGIHEVGWGHMGWDGDTAWGHR